MSSQESPFLQSHRASRETLWQWAAPHRLFMLLDACDAPAILQKIRTLGPQRAVSLYQGTAAERDAEIAPYLVEADPGLLEWLAAGLWNEPWGLFLVADCDSETLRHHLRRWLMVLDPQEQPVYFRFYDPRVLACFLPVCTPIELRELFGPIRAFGVTEADQVHLLYERNVAGTGASFRTAQFLARRTEVLG